MSFIIVIVCVRALDFMFNFVLMIITDERDFDRIQSVLNAAARLTADACMQVRPCDTTAREPALAACA